MKLSERSTSDLVVVFLAGVVGFVIIAGVVGLVILKILDPGQAIDSSVKVIGDLTTVIAGAVIGYVAGRATSNGENEVDE